ncbi:acyltransferase domain-containing protein [Brachybacterium sp. NBEC-018]|uniref:acyltransferase domain-containing protein n=1 Tax=Brachybacterium sp. NBEC-018 TaxID=2996004 RepID=UPI0021752CC2|nr:acyltransferase domain-containing protein [Brachybacterium sp. NBEC-018]UVY83656.1 acyltransferase domain-containing protein [Brachybacterium sp. NBEC-018]
MTSPAPTALHAEDELEAAAVRVMLTAPSRSALLDRLGITGEDAAELPALLDAAAADEEILTEVTALANRLRSGAGLEVPAVDLETEKSRHDALQQRLAPGEGLVPILALLVSTSTVRAWHAARGLSTEQSWHVLADLGQQMRVHRAGTGRLGLHQLNWVGGNWAGRLVHLGRLQFDLSRRRVARLATGAERTSPDEPSRWVVGTHIPATGPLDPAEVEASFAAATAYFSEHYADLGADRGEDEPAFGHEFTCDSWLLSEELAEVTGPTSNLARFAALWQMLVRTRMDDAALFFVFGLRPPVDPASLPRRTHLEQGVAERLADGRGWTGGTGRLLR